MNYGNKHFISLFQNQEYGQHFKHQFAEQMLKSSLAMKPVTQRLELERMYKLQDMRDDTTDKSGC